MYESACMTCVSPSVPLFGVDDGFEDGPDEGEQAISEIIVQLVPAGQGPLNAEDVFGVGIY